MLQVMIEAPHPLYTHSRSTSCIYEVFQYLLLGLAVIWMQTQPIYTWSHILSGGSRRFTWFLTCIMLEVLIEVTHPLHTHGRSALYIIKCFRAFHCGWRSYGCNISLICWVSHWRCCRWFTWVLSCNMLQVMIEAPHPLHTHSRFTSHTYNAI